MDGLPFLTLFGLGPLFGLGLLLLSTPLIVLVLVLTVISLRARVQRLEAVLQQKQIRAPFGGKLGIPRVDVGQYLSGR